MASKPSTVNQTNALSSQVLGVTPNVISSQSRTTTLSGLQRQIIIYYFGPAVTDEQKRNIMTAMMVYGKSASDRVKAWQSWVLTWACVCFPQMVGKFRSMRSTEYILEAFPESYISACDQMMATLQADSDATPEVPILAGFPLTNHPMNANFYNSGTVEGLYGYFALLVHLMGKTIGPTTRDAITTRRPSNIIDTFRCSHSSYVLRGAGRMSDAAHTQVRDAWDLSTAPRKVLIEELCLLGGSDDITAQIVNLMFRMLEYSGMQPALFIKDLLLACPWVIKDIPSLAPAYEVFINSVTAYANLSESLRPYTKVYHGNNTKIFHSKSMQDLTAVAVFWLSITNDSMAGYTAPGGDKAKAAFIKLAAAHGIDMTTGALDANTAIVAPEADDDE